MTGKNLININRFKVRQGTLFFVAIAVSLFMLAIPDGLSAQTKMSKKQKKEIKNVKKLNKKASKAFRKVMKIRDNAIPERLLRDAKAIAVFPGVKKAAFIFGGSGGKGMITRRLKSGWSAPAVFKMGEGSAGFQIGASSTDIILLFMNEDGLKNLLEDKFEIGVDAAAVAGPVGRRAAASTDAQLQAEILSYSRSKGLFAGVAVKGAVISPDDDANQAVYGMKARNMLTGVNKIAIADIPEATKLFQETVTAEAKKTGNR